MGKWSVTAPMRRARASSTWAVAMRRSWLVATARVTRLFRMASLNPCHQVTAVGAGAMLVWLPLAKAALTSVLGGWKFGPTAQPFRKMAEEAAARSNTNAPAEAAAFGKAPL